MRSAFHRLKAGPMSEGTWLGAAEHKSGITGCPGGGGMEAAGAVRWVNYLDALFNVMPRK
jgi:hypothetical protein